MWFQAVSGICQFLECIKHFYCIILYQTVLSVPWQASASIAVWGHLFQQQTSNGEWTCGLLQSQMQTASYTQHRRFFDSQLLEEFSSIWILRERFYSTNTFTDEDPYSTRLHIIHTKTN